MPCTEIRDRLNMDPATRYRPRRSDEPPEKIQKRINVFTEERENLFSFLHREVGLAVTDWSIPELEDDGGHRQEALS
eukprot:gene18429-biopygen5414